MKTTALFSVALAILLLACSPATKDDYMQEYAEFVESVEEKNKQEEIVEWESLDKEYDYYSDELYTKFKDELTLKDVIKVNAYKLRFETQRHKSSIIESLFGKEDIDEVKKKLEDYIKNEMDDDVDKLVKEAQRVSEEFGEAVKDLADELKREIEDEE